MAATILVAVGCVSGSRGPTFSSTPDLAAVMRIADAYSGPFEERIETPDDTLIFRWDGRNYAVTSPTSPSIETRRIDGVGCFLRADDHWVWNKVVDPTLATSLGDHIATAGIGILTSSGLRSPDATARSHGDDLVIGLSGVDGVDRGVIHFDDGHLDTIEWFDGDRRIASATYSFDPEPVTRPAGAKEGIDVQC